MRSGLVHDLHFVAHSSCTHNSHLLLKNCPPPWPHHRHLDGVRFRGPPNSVRRNLEQHGRSTRITKRKTKRTSRSFHIQVMEKRLSIHFRRKQKHLKSRVPKEFLPYSSDLFFLNPFSLSRSTEPAFHLREASEVLRLGTTEEKPVTESYTSICLDHCFLLTFFCESIQYFKKKHFIDTTPPFLHLFIGENKKWLEHPHHLTGSMVPRPLVTE